ncbi:hypothetical protein LOC68_07640 [Blastopirellula sp. JC732]|uniref:DUF6896 domain-containing protein n=1 Tax=Blastopirellula sediminis TaxID=2894196 RepID=A0A9X1MJI0_9BACT|nr:hypothetical protein [Blastopirellula sediminis]MCC9608960.1 hypothetical protein [Blastopirellula sediminis]MCC9628263.1 hypothetical protein [Blastopirellula sediminis]
MDSEELKGKLEEFESLIREVIAIFVHQFGRANPGSLWRKGEIERIGLAGPNEEVEFSIHGRGCTVLFKNAHLSFDYDQQGDIVYTPFKFLLYLPDGVIEHRELEALFVELYDVGELEYIEGRGVRLKG